MYSLQNLEDIECQGSLTWVTNIPETSKGPYYILENGQWREVSTYEEYAQWIQQYLMGEPRPLEEGQNLEGLVGLYECSSPTPSSALRNVITPEYDPLEILGLVGSYYLIYVVLLIGGVKTLYGIRDIVKRLWDKT
jgi:hypothetical protein